MWPVLEKASATGTGQDPSAGEVIEGAGPFRTAR